MIRARCLYLVARLLHRCGLRPAALRVEHRASRAWVIAYRGKAWVEARTKGAR